MSWRVAGKGDEIRSALFLMIKIRKQEIQTVPCTDCRVASLLPDSEKLGQLFTFLFIGFNNVRNLGQ